MVCFSKMWLLSNMKTWTVRNADTPGAVWKGVECCACRTIDWQNTKHQTVFDEKLSVKAPLNLFQKYCDIPCHLITWPISRWSKKFNTRKHENRNEAWERNMFCCCSYCMLCHHTCMLDCHAVATSHLTLIQWSKFSASSVAFPLLFLFCLTCECGLHQVLHQYLAQKASCE